MERRRGKEGSKPFPPGGQEGGKACFRAALSYVRKGADQVPTVCARTRTHARTHARGQAAEAKCEAAVKNNTADLMEELGQVIPTDLSIDVCVCACVRV